METAFNPETEAFEERRPEETWSVQFESFEGPVDLLLSLARDQKLDLAKISILKLAEEYIAYIEQARELRLEIAADYLVMAAWLAYLKSRFLLPKEEQQTDEPTPQQMADALAFQLRRLAAMQKAANDLFERPQLRSGLHRRGRPEGFAYIVKPKWQDSLLDVLRSYGDIRRRAEKPVYHPPEPYQLYTMDEAIDRIGQLFGARNLWRSGEWSSLEQFLPSELKGLADSKSVLLHRSTMACLFGASLEMARLGSIEVRQDHTFGPIYIRSRRGEKAA